jgi:colanic acid biosynthesis glycosyl transferase WcaI
MLTLSLSIFFKALLNFKKGDKVLVVTTPPSLPFITALASLIKGANYTLLIHDNYPEILIAVSKTTENSVLAKSVNYSNRWLYKFAQKIIVCGRDMKTLVEQKIYGLDIPIRFIPNWAELEQVEPRPRSNNKLLKELNLQDKFIFLYAGNMGYPNDLESIIECAEKLETNEVFHFIFLGAGVKRKYLEREASEKNLTNITILEPRPRTEQTDFLNACDVALVSLVKKMLGVSMPSRTYNILAVGKPILALTEEDSEVAKVINENQVGWLVPPNEPDKLLEMIFQIYNERENLPAMSIRARDSAVQRYSLEAAVSAYRSELQK